MVKYGLFWDWTSKCQNRERHDSIGTHNSFSIRKNTQYSNNYKILKSGKNGHFATAIIKQNGQNWLISGMNLKVTKNMQKKTTLEAHSTVLEWYVCWLVARFCRQLLREQLTKLHSVLLFLILKWMNLRNLFDIDSDILLLFLAPVWYSMKLEAVGCPLF